MENPELTGGRGHYTIRPAIRKIEGLVVPWDGRSFSRFNCITIYALFFCSGMASLICETVWFKQLQFVLGSSTFSVSVVVACFFGGLAFGGWLGGRLADRSRHLLNLSALILIVPTTLMGSTLPVLGTLQAWSNNVLARRIGLLYGVNTLGAAVGCYLAGFILIGRLGVIRSALLASVIYVAIAAGAAIAVRLATRGDHRATDEAATGPGILEDVSAPRSAGWLTLVFFLMGFVSIAYEVLWFRLLSYFGVHTVYAFAGMLCTYLLGLVLGSLINTKYLAHRTDRHLADLARIQVMVVAAVVFSLALLGRSRSLLKAIEGFEHRLGGADTLASLFSGQSSFLCLCLIVLLLPCTLLGIGFPLAMELTARQHTALGSRLGWLYGINTLGGVLGSLVVGFGLLPLLGSQGSYTVVVLLNL